MARPPRTSAGFAWKRATGVLHVGDRLVITRAALGARGRITSSTEVVVLAEGADGVAPVTAALTALVEQGRIPPPVICGLDPRALYAVTRQVTQDEKDVTAAELVATRMGAMEGGITAAMQATRLPNGSFRTVVAASRSRAKDLLTGLQGIKARAVQLPPMPQVILASAAARARRPRGWQAVIRVLSGAQFGMALLSVGEQAVAWRMFAPGRDGKLAIGPAEHAMLSLLHHARNDLLLEQVDGGLLHLGTDTPAGEQLAERLCSDLAIPVRCAGRMVLDHPSLSAALAHWGLRQPLHELDLLRGLQPRTGLRENFPRRAAALTLSTLAGCGGFLFHEASTLEAQARQVEAQAARDAGRAGIKVSALKKEHETLKSTFDVAWRFIEDRVYWEELLIELPSTLPSGMRVTRIKGDDALRLSEKSGSAAKASSIEILTELALTGSTESPPEVPVFAAALRASPAFARHFARLSSSTLRVDETRTGGAVARLTVKCLRGPR